MLTRCTVTSKDDFGLRAHPDATISPGLFHYKSYYKPAVFSYKGLEKVFSESSTLSRLINAHREILLNAFGDFCEQNMSDEISGLVF